MRIRPPGNASMTPEIRARAKLDRAAVAAGETMVNRDRCHGITAGVVRRQIATLEAIERRESSSWDGALSARARDAIDAHNAIATRKGRVPKGWPRVRITSLKSLQRAVEMGALKFIALFGDTGPATINELRTFSKTDFVPRNEKVFVPGMVQR